MDFNFTGDLVGFWNLYVMVIVGLSVIGCGVFLWMQDFAKHKPGEVTGHVWDETLEEYSNPLPNWWRWMFYITVVFAIVYLALYPGFGNMTGSFGWTMRGQYDAEMKAAEATYGPKFNQFLKQDVMTVATNKEAREMGQRLFQTYCEQCHGGDAGGATSFPNLKDGDWLWGGTPEKIKETIVAGRMGIMTPKGVKPDMDAEQVKDVVAYVRSLSGLDSKSGGNAEKGKELYLQACAACHQADGKGMQAAGYPNLTDKIWLHGSSEAKQIEIVTKGMQNQMPAFGEFLGPAKVHLLTAYVWGLGGGVKSEGAAEGPMAVLEGNVAKFFFGTGKSDIGAEGGDVVRGLLQAAAANPAAKFAISGFHDATGDKAANEELAKHRAMAVRDALQSAGVAADRIELRKPVETTGSGDNKEARRVEAAIL